MNLLKRIGIWIMTGALCIGILAPTALAAEKNTVYGIGFVTASRLNMRSADSTSSAILARAENKECVVVLDKVGEWYKVNYNLKEGYMHEDYLTVSNRENAELGYGKVSGNSVNLRSGPSTAYSVVAKASKNAKCYIIGINQGWYKVIYGNSICYIRSDYLELTEVPYENKASQNKPLFFRMGKSTGTRPSAAALNGNTSSNTSGSKPSATGVSGEAILREAQKYLGVRYVYGGASPSGFDCSGFVYYVLKQLGYAPYRTPADQYSMGSYVAKSQLKPGDIVFFAGTYASGISHVGIYAGNGQFIHAPNSRSTVSYSDLTSGYWAQHYYGARRMS